MRGRTRRYLETADDSVFTGNPIRVAAAIYDAIDAALTERRAALRSQKDLAASVAFADGATA